MATARSGALVDGLRGSLGGIVFGQKGGATTMRVRVKPTGRSTMNQAGAKAIMRAAVVAWRGESAVTRQAWEALAGWMSGGGGGGGKRYANGYAAYVANMCAQTGALAPAQAVPPLNFSVRARAGLRVQNWGSSIYLVGLSRELLADEQMLITVMAPYRAGLKRPPQVVSRYVALTYVDNPTAGYDQSIYIDTSGTSPESHMGSAGSSTWCFECWLKPDTIQIVHPRVVFHNDPYNQYLYTDSGQFIWCDGGASRNIGVDPMLYGHWNHVGLVMDGAAGKVALYVNGSLVGPAQACTVHVLGSGTWIGSVDGISSGVVGFYDQICLWKVSRDAAYMLGRWNGGVPQRLRVDATNQVWLLYCDDLGLVLADATGGGWTATRSVAVNGLGSCGKLLMPAGSWSPVGTGTFRTIARMGVGGLWFQGQVEANYLV